MPTIYDGLSAGEGFLAGLAGGFAQGVGPSLQYGIQDAISPPRPEDMLDLGGGRTLSIDPRSGDPFINGKRYHGDLNQLIGFSRLRQDQQSREQRERFQIEDRQRDIENEEQRRRERQQSFGMEAARLGLSAANTMSVMQGRTADRQQEMQQQATVEANRRKQTAANRQQAQGFFTAMGERGVALPAETVAALTDLADQFDPAKYLELLQSSVKAHASGRGGEIDQTVIKAAGEAREQRITNRVASLKDQNAQLTERLKGLMEQQAAYSASQTAEAPPVQLSPDDQSAMDYQFSPEVFDMTRYAIEQSLARTQRMLRIEQKKSALLPPPGMPNDIMQFDAAMPVQDPRFSMVGQITELAEELFIAETGRTPTAQDVEQLDQIAQQLAAELGWTFPVQQVAR